MRIMTTGITLFAATALALSASAQTTPTAPQITRTIVAATKLPSVVETPLYFKATRTVTLQPGAKSNSSAANGILYQLSGSTGHLARRRKQGARRRRGIVCRCWEDGVAERRKRRALNLALLPACPGRRTWPADRHSPCGADRAIPHGGTDSRLEAGRLRPQPNPRHVSGRDAVQPAASSLGSGALLHRLGNGRQHRRRHDEDKDPDSWSTSRSASCISGETPAASL